MQKNSMLIASQVDQMALVDKELTMYMGYKAPFTCGIQKIAKWAGYPCLAHSDSATNLSTEACFCCLLPERAM